MNNRRRKIANGILLLIFMCGSVWMVIYAKSNGILDQMTSVEAFQGYIKGFGTKARIAYFLIQFMSVVIAPIPSNISTAAGGNIFGMWESFFISTFAIITGSILVFLLARKFGKPFAERLVSPEIINKYEKLMTLGNFELMLLLLFFLPFFPDDVICFLAGLGVIKWSRFFIIMILTRPWGILAASAVGSSKVFIPWWGWAIIALIVISAMKYHKEIEEKLMKAITNLQSMLSYAKK